MWELLLRGLHPRPTAEFPRGNQKRVPIDRKSRIYDDFTSFPRVQIPLSPPLQKCPGYVKNDVSRTFSLCTIRIKIPNLEAFFRFVYANFKPIAHETVHELKRGDMPRVRFDAHEIVYTCPQLNHQYQRRYDDF